MKPYTPGMIESNLDPTWGIERLICGHGYNRVYTDACRRVRRRQLRAWWSRYCWAAYLVVLMAALMASGNVR